MKTVSQGSSATADLTGSVTSPLGRELGSWSLPPPHSSALGSREQPPSRTRVGLERPDSLLRLPGCPSNEAIRRQSSSGCARRGGGGTRTRNTNRSPSKTDRGEGSPRQQAWAPTIWRFLPREIVKRRQGLRDARSCKRVVALHCPRPPALSAAAGASSLLVQAVSASRCPSTWGWTKPRARLVAAIAELSRTGCPPR